MPIRQKVSQIVEVPIRTGRWVTYTEALDREGKFTRKTMLEIVMVLCEEMEIAEQSIITLQDQLESLLKEKESPTVSEPQPEETKLEPEMPIKVDTDVTASEAQETETQTPQDTQEANVEEKKETKKDVSSKKRRNS